MIEPHHISAAGTAAVGGLTLADMTSGGGDWRIVLINAGITLLSALVTKFFANRAKKGGGK